VINRAWGSITANGALGVQGHTTLYGGLSVAGDAVIAPTAGAGLPALAINAQINNAAEIFGQHSGTNRQWRVRMPEASVDGHFQIIRRDDFGLEHTALTVNRHTGDAVFGGEVMCSNGLPSRGFVVDKAHFDGISTHTASMVQALDVAGATISLDGIHATGVFIAARIQLAGQAFDFRHDAQAYKAGGGVWGDISDARIKNVLGDYQHGLAEIEQLQPVTYTFKGNDTVTAPANAPLGNDEPTSRIAPRVPYRNSSHYQVAVDQKKFIGLTAQNVESVLPEMITTSSGWIDGKQVQDLRGLDTSPLLFALINAVKELSARIKQLEARGA
jgi:hypothetical protein